MWWKCVATCAGKWMWWSGRRGCVFTPRETHLLSGGYCDCWWTAILLMIGSILYGCERWTIKKTERWRTDAFKLVLEKILESPVDWKERKPVNPKWNQLRIFIGRTDAEAEALILWPPDAKSQHLGRTLMLETTEGRRRRGQQRMRELDGITYSMYMSFSKLHNTVKDREAWRAAVHRVTKSQTGLSDWTATIIDSVHPPSEDFPVGQH